MTITPEQIETRRSGIGGSDAAAVLGVSRWRTPLDVYLDKRGEALEVERPNDWFLWGNLLEDPIASVYEQRTGRATRRVLRTLRHREHDYMLAHLDRRIVGERGIVEIKTAGAYDRTDWGEPGSDEVPHDYIAQCQHYLAVTEMDFADLAVLFMRERRFEVYRIERSESVIDQLVTLEGAFWERVVSGDPPSPTSVADARKLWTDSLDESVEASPNALAALERIASLKAEVKAAESEAQALTLDVLREMELASELRAPTGELVATWRSQRQVRVDNAALDAAHPGLRDQYKRESRTRVFLNKVKAAQENDT